MTLATLPGTKAYFRGRWQMVRLIENATEGIIGEFWGEAVFAPPEGDTGDSTLICREAGVLRFRGQDYHAERATRWCFPDDGGRVEVDYEDGSPFHDFTLLAPSALHRCGEDRYEVAYEFEFDSWMSHWSVRGPRKDYRMSTRYRRIG